MQRKMGNYEVIQRTKDGYLAKGLNYIVFGRHETGIRQTATQEEMTKLRDLEKHLAFSIDMGMINSFDELIQKMRDVYLKKIDF